MSASRKSDIGKKAWIITWRDDRQLPFKDEVAAFCNSRMSEKRVGEIMQRIFNDRNCNFSEKLDIAAGRNDALQDYCGVHYGDLNGVKWTGALFCGISVNPYLYARIVTNIVIQVDDGGNEVPQWIEPSNPDVEWDVQ